ncbi:ABC transporter permease [Inquilinus limosus]|uniref:Peptide ABC transporter permease n=1 Tax=Inquilinus limosus TaxID=171674 RepID=A0A211ZA44_9PROT|nr:ABC transporter permease [Inquilinus limosus]OWJ62096.1 peptide ABC transporter permease [Inquilinus limosus]
MAFVARRLIFYMVAFLVAASINFLIPRLMPGDPIDIMFSQSGTRLSVENLAALKATFGFVDGPLWQQYLSYLGSIFSGDLGMSVKYFPTPVSDVLGRALVWTLVLMGGATLLSFTLGTLLGIGAAWRRGSRFDVTVSTTAIIATATPAVVVSLFGLFVFGFTLQWFPTGYAADTAIDPAFSAEYILSVAYHAILPIVTLSVVLTGDFLVTMRNNMINLLGEDYITMGRAKGLADRRVMLMYGARNALLPGVTSLAIAIGKILGGSLVTEVVFNYPGLGNTLYKAILGRDYPVIQGQLLIMTLAMLAANFLADIAYAWLDPRLRRS